ncbi:putative phosphate repressible phosphate permease [Trypanosoma vivax]|nr:putative phosphate repressible phosphate permease [Trypanosoma vivax]
MGVRVRVRVRVRAEHGAAADAPGGGCLGTKSISAYMVDEGKHSTEMYDSRVEYVFRYLQVFTAVCASFAHGANDVSNAVGPFAAIYSIYENKAVMARNDMPIWILCLGGAGIVCGLATLGVRIMRLLVNASRASRRAAALLRSSPPRWSCRLPPPTASRCHQRIASRGLWWRSASLTMASAASPGCL